MNKMPVTKDFGIVNNVKASDLYFKDPPKYKREIPFHWVVIYEGKTIGFIETISGNALQTWTNSVFKRTEEDVQIAREKIEIKKCWARDHNIPILFLEFSDVVNEKFCMGVLNTFFTKILPKTGPEAMLDKIFELSKLATEIKDSLNETNR